MENNTLQHHGVKGMKWGVHKATPKDRRFFGDAKNVAGVSNPASKGFEGGSKAAGAIGNLAGRKPSKKVQKELNSMSDQELRNRINRMQMEQQYAALNPNAVQRGASFTKSILEVGAGIATIAGSAASIYMLIKKAKTSGL